MEPHPSSTWFPNRVDRRKATRLRLRWGAVLFNGLFLAAYWLWAGSPSESGFMLFAGIMMTLFGLNGVIAHRYRLVERDQLERIVLDRGVADYRWMRVAVYRQRVLLGRDEGWVGRRAGALVFEGRTTRFEIVRDDLVYVPTGAPDEVPGRLTVKSERGTVDVWFTATAWEPKDSGADVIRGWTPAERQLGGPPLVPNVRTFGDRLRMAQGANEWVTWPFILFGLSFLLPTDGWALIAIRLVLFVTGTIALWIALVTTWRKDDADILRLVKEDAARRSVAPNVVIQTNNAGTGNPAPNAAVG